MPWSPKPRIRCPSVTTITSRPVFQHLVKTVAVWIGHEQAARSTVDLAETLAGLTHGGGIDDRQGFGDVVTQHPVEQGLVAVLQRAEIDVFVEIALASGEFMPAMFGLLFQGLHRGRQQAQQTVAAALGLGKGRALGRQGVEKGGLPSLFVSHR
jgi:hypothetical protein